MFLEVAHWCRVRPEILGRCLPLRRRILVHLPPHVRPCGLADDLLGWRGVFYHLVGGCAGCRWDRGRGMRDPDEHLVLRVARRAVGADGFAFVEDVADFGVVDVAEVSVNINNLTITLGHLRRVRLRVHQGHLIL